MKIQQFEVSGLHGNEESITLNFHDDLNILSGRNGAGKTTILKLMWYLVSGNFDKAAAEITFESAMLKTDKYELNVRINFQDKDRPFSSKLQVKDVNTLKIKGIDNDENFKKILNNKSKTDIAWFITQYIDSSFFMPTFRMIEGGFTTEKYDIKHDVTKEFYLNLNKENDYNEIDNALKKLSKNLTKKDHIFITSISAKDIDDFLVKKYAEIMKKVNQNQRESLNFLGKKVSMMLKQESDSEIFITLDKKIDDLEIETKLLNEPLKKIKMAVAEFIPIFRIEFDEKIYFSKVEIEDLNEVIQEENEESYYLGDQTYDIDFDVAPKLDELELEDLDFDNKLKLTINNLSAGEKQLLTFVAYNIFNNDTIFFIDEPELSLHVDWQNKLFSLLKEQNPSNQFIISTHSPFIYSLFPDKELVIDSDKGCSEF